MSSGNFSKLAKAKELRNAEYEANAHSRLGGLAVLRDEPEAAIAHYSASVNILTGSGSHRLVEALIALANARAMAGDFDGARALMAQLREMPVEEELLANSELLLACATGDLAALNQLTSKLLAAKTPLPIPRDALGNAIRFASYRTKSSFIRSGGGDVYLDQLNAARSNLRELECWLDLSEATGALAECLGTSNRFNELIALSKEWEADCLRGGIESEAEIAIHNRVIALEMGGADSSAVVQAIESQEALCEKLNFDEGRLRTKSNRARLALRAGDHLKAIELFRKIERDTKGTEVSELRIETIANLVLLSVKHNVPCNDTAALVEEPIHAAFKSGLAQMVVPIFPLWAMINGLQPEHLQAAFYECMDQPEGLDSIADKYRMK